ncbi:MAG: hypothetical protein RL385_4257 [Pseudomonadota bacterium]
MRIPDSPGNRGYFGDHYSGETQGLDGSPLARLVTLMALRSHLIVAAEVGPYQNEREMAAPLWTKLPDASLVLIDGGFRADAAQIPLHSSGGEPPLAHPRRQELQVDRAQ